MRVAVRACYFNLPVALALRHLPFGPVVLGVSNVDGFNITFTVCTHAKEDI